MVAGINVYLGLGGLVSLTGLVAAGQDVTARTSLITSTTNTQIPHSRFNINYRQIPPIPPPLPSTSSYDYWWPYPPGGVATITSTSMPTPFPVTTPILTFSFPLPSSISTDGPTTSQNIPSDSSLTSTTATSSDANTTTAVFSTPSIIYITALPPLPSNSSISSHTLPKHAAFSTHTHNTYLVPLFGVLGLVIGSCVAWFCYGFFMARRRGTGGGRRGREELEVGPAYCYDEKGGVIEDVFYGENEETKAGGTVFSWPTPKGYEHEEGQAFLAPPSPSKSAKKSTRMSKSARTARTKTTRLAHAKIKSPYPASDLTGSPDPLSLLFDEEEDEEKIETRPYESLKHGSRTIRRGLLEQVKFGTSLEVDLGEGEKGGDRLDQSQRRRVSRGHERNDSDPCVGGDGDGGADETKWVPGSGFRIVEEDLEGLWGVVGGWARAGIGRVGSMRNGRSKVLLSGPSTPVKEREGFTWAGVGGGEKEGDRYSPMPVRKSPNKAKVNSKPGVVRTTTTLNTPGWERGGVKGREALPRVDSSVLPLSPPQITSPPLESQLLFTPRVGQAPISGPEKGLSLQSDEKRARTRAKEHRGAEGKKLRSPRPPALPFPSGGRLDVYRGRLVKTSAPPSGVPPAPPARRMDTASSTYTDMDFDFGSDTGSVYTTIAGDNLVSSPPPSCTSPNTRSKTRSRNAGGSRGTPAQRYTARKAALGKVEEIVERSWSVRDLGDVAERVGSPTGFGARAS